MATNENNMSSADETTKANDMSTMGSALQSAGTMGGTMNRNATMSSSSASSKDGGTSEGTPNENPDFPYTDDQGVNHTPPTIPPHEEQ
jgi:hypothetical protein